MLHVGLQSDDMHRESRRVWGESSVPFSLSQHASILTHVHAFSHTLCPSLLSQTPNLLTFFIASTAWNAASFGLLRLGGEVSLAVGSALILPMTLLAFIRPVPLPYSWAAPPEPLSLRNAKLGGLLILALGFYHSAAVASALSALRSTKGFMRTSPSGMWSRRGSRTSGRRGGADRYSAGSSPGGLVGPSLHL